MNCCSINSPTQFEQEFSGQINQSADRLAALLTQTPEYQEFLRFAQLIHLDPDVKRLSLAIRNQQMHYAESQDATADSLEEELEVLPAVQAYRKAEEAVKGLLRSVDQIISAGAGVTFAPNAVKSGCG
jgi:cell fate (sporulation/competence/biofilm development) regulator YmcA (YheA/YmcA/DUF963 family)